MSDGSAWQERHQRTTAFLAAFLLFMLLQQVKSIAWFRWDAGDYWSLSAPHELLNFPAVIRGYFYPLLLAPGRYVFDLYPEAGYSSYRIFSSAAYAYMLAVVLPGFYGMVFGGRITFWCRLVVPLLVSVIYPGLIIYPLSDLPATCLMLGAAVSGIHSVACSARPLARYAWLFLAGISAYGAYNTRTIFLFSVLVFAIGVPLVIYRGHPWQTRLPAAVVFLAGIVVAGLPQTLINIKHDKGWVPAVVTSSGGKSLFAQQLLWGMVVQKYETTLDGSAQLPAVVYPDEDGERLVRSLHVARDFTVMDYLKLVMRHPWRFAGIYGRHVVNGLDVRDGDAYSTVLSPSRNGLALVNFLIVFIGLSIMLSGLSRHLSASEADVTRLFWVSIVLLPVIMIVPGAVETRFFLSLNLAIYSAIAFSGGLSGMIRAFRERWLASVLIFSVAALIFFSVSLRTMSDLEYGSQHVQAILDGAQSSR